MVEIPDSLHTLFSATVEERDGTYQIEVPREEIDHDSVVPGEAYRIAVFPKARPETDSPDVSTRERSESRSGTGRTEQGPPVDEGEVRDVTVESLGDQGDGIAKVERGYVVIVPEAEPGDEVTVEIEEVRENVAFANIVSDERGPA